MSRLSMRLRYLRNSNKLSQQALADIAGISKSSINMYERGDREPGIETLEFFADYFNVDMDYLMGRIDDPKGNTKRMFDSSLNPILDIPGVLPMPEMRKKPVTSIGDELSGIKLSDEAKSRLNFVLERIASLSDEDWSKVVDYINLLEAAQKVGKDY